MNCNNFSAVSKVSPLCKKVRAGNDELWLISRSSVLNYSIGLTSGMVDSITLATGSFFAPIGVLKNSLGIDTEGAIDVDKGTSDSTNTITYRLSDLTLENQKHIRELELQPLVAISKSRTAKRYTLGLENDLYLTAFTATTGKLKGDDVGYGITLTEDSELTPRILNPTVTGIYGTAI